MEITGASVNLIRLADGTLIDPLTKAPINASLQPKKNSSKQKDEELEEEPEEDEDADVELNLVPTARRSIMDLALSPQQMAFINNVLVYTLWGLPDDEIAIQCNCSIHNIHIVRNLDDYKRIHEALVEGLRVAYMSTVQGIMQNAAPQAAKKMVKRINHKSPDISLSAMKDILDRSGHRPSDKVEHNHTFGGGELVIRVIKSTDKNAIPTLDLDINA